MVRYIVLVQYPLYPLKICAGSLWSRKGSAVQNHVLICMIMMWVTSLKICVKEAQRKHCYVGFGMTAYIP